MTSCCSIENLETGDRAVKYSIVVPVYNSQQTLIELCERITSSMENQGESFELILVDDCSSDRSWQMIEQIAAGDVRVFGLQLMKNSGQGTATLTGLSHSNGSLCITLDDDLQHPPEEIPTLIQALKVKDEIDVIMGVPVLKRHNLYRRTGSSIINLLNTWFLQKDPEIRLTGFRIIRRHVVDAILAMRIPCPALGPMIITVTSRIENVIVRHDPRKFGKSGYTSKRLIEQALSNLIGYSTLPLRVLALIGIVGIIISFLLGIYFLVRYYTVGISVTGWTSVLLTLLALSGLNFIAFAITGEYLLRIVQISMGTSRYLVRKGVHYEHITKIS